MPFRFIHTADIHLDSPLRSLALRDEGLAELVGNATRAAFVSIIDLCLDEQVDALIIAGDLYDGDQTSMKTARFLSGQMQRLNAADIAVYKIRGNHDALSRITQELVLPDNVKVFGGRAEAVGRMKDGLDICIHGMSFAKPQAPESLLPRFKAPIAGAVNIGIMHTSLAGAQGHDVYAPCSVSELHASGFDYWALGHIHQRTHHHGARTVIMPGMPQGRDINEAGAKTVSLVTVADDQTITIEERLTSVAQFERVSVDLTNISEWREAAGAVELALARQREATASRCLVARLRLIGQTPLSWRLHRDIDLLRTEAEERGARIGQTWIEKLELAVHAPVDVWKVTADPVIELGDLMREKVMASAGFRDEIGVMVKDLLADLPPESRGFAGDDPASFERFIDELMLDGADDITARMKTWDHGEN